MNSEPVISQRSRFALGCAGAIVLGAFLLFQVQPIISKIILPWFGGSPAVWTTCMLFFQVLLLGGYAYANQLARIASARRQAAIHLGLLAGAVLILPITPGPGWKPPDGQLPALRILVLLTVNLGLPYFLLAATSPLIQSWFARVYPSRSPYRLYALSNVGSLVALLSYPFLIEPSLTTSVQDAIWSAMFVVFVLCCGYLTYALWRSSSPGHINPLEFSPTGDDATRNTITGRQRLSWLFFPTVGSVMLLAVTNHLCLNISVVPLFWVAPLSVYLLTFIICFDHSRWYRREVYGFGTIAVILLIVYLLAYKEINGVYWDWTGSNAPLATLRNNTWFAAGVYLFSLFMVCMICHGELVRRKPPPRQLTSFYLHISAGGAFGGVLVAVVCPLVFPVYLELPLTLIVAFLISMAIVGRRFKQSLLRGYRWVVVGAEIVALIVFAVVTWALLFSENRANVASARNFYGVITVWEHDINDPSNHGRSMFHGNTMHGFQFLQADKRQLATTYYAREAGVGLAIIDKQERGPVHVGMVGLGTGTLATYGRAGDRFRFYEINPLVVALAEEYFTFLSECPAQLEIVSGDARLSLEREPPNEFDVLVLDAFSSDAVPAHLLTREAMEIYLKHLKPDGILAIHTSNRYLNLGVVTVSLAEAFDLNVVRVSYKEKSDIRAEASSHWYLLAQVPEPLESGRIDSVAEHPRIDQPVLWTDKYNNLFQIIR